MYVCMSGGITQIAPRRKGQGQAETSLPLPLRKPMAEAFYSFKLISYNTLDFLISKLEERSANYYIIEHDKDIEEDGKQKQAHFHIVFTVPVRMRFKQVFDFFNVGQEQNTLVKVAEDLTHDIRYLTHKDNPKKAQYLDEEVITNNPERYRKYIGGNENTDEEKNERFIEDLLSLTTYQMCVKYGRDFMRYYKQYNEVKKVIQTEFNELENDKQLYRMIRS